MATTNMHFELADCKRGGHTLRSAAKAARRIKGVSSAKVKKDMVVVTISDDPQVNLIATAEAVAAKITGR